MERKKGSYILNDVETLWTGRAQAIHVTSDAIFSTIDDTRRKTADYYISDPIRGIKAGSYIAARDGAQFTAIQITQGIVEIIF